MRTMQIAIVAILWGAVAQTGRAQESSTVMAAINKFVDAFNKGDVKTATAACAEQTSIIDDFTPHEWHGAGACSKWMSDYDADAKKNALTDGFVTLGKARHVDVSKDVAYVVVPADYAYKMSGKPVKESGSMLTVALRKGAAGWRITGWSWSKN
jgi:ketosteroid isomerase-like protein